MRKWYVIYIFNATTHMQTHMHAHTQCKAFTDYVEIRCIWESHLYSLSMDQWVFLNLLTFWIWVFCLYIFSSSFSCSLSAATRRRHFWPLVTKVNRWQYPQHAPHLCLVIAPPRTGVLVTLAVRGSPPLFPKPVWTSLSNKECSCVWFWITALYIDWIFKYLYIGCVRLLLCVTNMI